MIEDIQNDGTSNTIFDGTYWDFCIRTAPDCFHIFPDREVDVDFDKLNEKRDKFRWKGIGYSKCVNYISLEVVYTILRNIFPADILTEYVVRLEKDELQRLRVSRLFIEETPTEFNSYTRRPYYRMRGKSVTEEQAFDVIRKTDHYITWNFRYSNRLEKCIHFDNEWLRDSPFLTRFGWMHPDGIAGINWHTNKYPTFLELLAELMEYQSFFPFLDFTVTITWWDEYPPYTESGSYKGINDEVLGQCPEFLDNVAFGVCLNGNSIGFLGKERAIKAYQKYDELYSNPDYRVYIPELCENHNVDMEAYFQRCIASFEMEKD